MEDLGVVMIIEVFSAKRRQAYAMPWPEIRFFDGLTEELRSQEILVTPTRQSLRRLRVELTVGPANTGRAHTD